MAKNDKRAQECLRPCPAASKRDEILSRVNDRVLVDALNDHGSVRNGAVVENLCAAGTHGGRAGYTGQGQDNPLLRAVLLSGVAEKELNTFLAAWKHLSLPRQNWATLTPTSEAWALIGLLAELDLERVALGG